MNEFQPASEVIAWIALRRLNRGYVRNLAGQWFDSGHPVPSYLVDSLDQLARDRSLTLADPIPGDFTRRAMLTDSGDARYVDLLRKYQATHLAQADLRVPPPEFSTVNHVPSGRQPSAEWC